MRTDSRTGRWVEFLMFTCWCWPLERASRRPKDIGKALWLMLYPIWFIALIPILFLPVFVCACCACVGEMWDTES